MIDHPQSRQPSPQGSRVRFDGDMRLAIGLAYIHKLVLKRILTGVFHQYIQKMGYHLPSDSKADEMVQKSTIIPKNKGVTGDTEG